ncbi:MAG TPA: FHA domain-containing protein, partial [Myxococcota bacterium]|nr:FHA domain-containing protein [Myxococcota bacterium]
RPVMPEPERTVAVHLVEDAPKPKTADDDHRAAPKAREAITVAPARAFVVYFDAEGNENEMEIPHDRPLVVGRRSTADLRMQDHGISSMHAAFEWVDGGLAVRDLGSTNGTWVHGERVPRATLQDQDVVRLGLVPVRVRFLAPVLHTEVPVAEVEVEPRWEEPEPEPAPVEELSDHEDALMPMPEEPGPAVWHLLFVTDNGTIACVNVDEHDNCVVAGEGPVEISVSGRGLKPEHLQFDWAESGLQVMQARRDATLKVNGEAADEVTLKNGDVVSAGSLIIRVVRGPTATATAQSGGYTQLHQKWAGHFKRLDPELELLFIDPEAAGGRAELSVWGDGMAQVDVHTGAAHERYTARLDQDFQRLLLKALTRSGFPDLPHGARRNSVAGPELHAFWAEDRSDVVLSDWLAATSSAWREVRDLLRAIADHIIG